MAFTDLKRNFIPISKDQEGITDVHRYWGHLSGGLTWHDLLKYRRVVLLAEAQSGKTAEFRHQAEYLTKSDKSAFFVRIEDLSDEGFDAALDPACATQFADWRKTSKEGWFFLDSVDEARLNHKSLETALRKFARALDVSLDRAHIYVSCRVTDWQGQADTAIIERLLPARPLEEEEELADPLLDPIFKSKKKDNVGLFQQKQVSPKQYAELKVVQIAPLDNEQYRLLAASAGVADVDALVVAINKKGLDSFTERPGDLLDLANYWRSYGRFGSLEQMTEHAIANKLAEADPLRPDGGELTAAQIREGAERLAAALTLGKSFTIALPAHKADDQLATGAIDPVATLPNQTDAQRSALLRKAIFAPSTYGRVRFHHRGTQEYLTACWIKRLLHANCPKSEVWQLLFADPYGVETVIPSLRPAAAWLSIWFKDIAAEVLRREPLTLIRNGDPASLPIKLKEKLLENYARKDAAADISNDSIDHRAIWLFSESKLAATINRLWKANFRPEFRLTLLRIVREGELKQCVAIARAAAISKKEDYYNRIVASEILNICKDKQGLADTAEVVIRDRKTLGARLSASLAVATFPEYLSVPNLLKVIEANPDRRDVADGFSYQLGDLYQKCRSNLERKQLIEGVVRLANLPPHVSQYQRISSTFLPLAKGFEVIARAELEALGGKKVPQYLVDLLMVIERCDRMPDLDKQKPLRNVVETMPEVRRALFWADVAEHRKRESLHARATRFWQIHFQGEKLWSFKEDDISWIEKDMLAAADPNDAKVALSVLVHIWGRDGLPAGAAALKPRLSSSSVLLAELEDHLKPHETSLKLIEHEKRMRTYAEKHEKKVVENKASWQRFKAKLTADPIQLSRPDNVKSWRTGAFQLYDLARWLHHKANDDGERSSRDWKLLADGFSLPIAEAYRDGMKNLWRLTKPARPVRTGNNTFTTNNQNILAYKGVGLEANDDAAWATKLTAAEARRAAQHGSFTERGYPDWMDDLAIAQQGAAIPVIRDAVAYEWNSEHGGLSSFLYRFADPRLPVPEFLQAILFKILVSTNPKRLETLSVGARILNRLSLTIEQKSVIEDLAKKRLAKHAKNDETDWALRYLSLLLSINPDEGVKAFERWLGPKPEKAKERSEAAFAALFDRHDALVSGLLTAASADTLERLLLLSYKVIKPKDDNVHEGVFTPDRRDGAEQARNEILGAILNKPGPDAYQSFRRAIENPVFDQRRHRFMELARGKAERDSESPAWMPNEVISFETLYTAPAKTGQDLLRVVMAVLDDIAHSFAKDDASSKSVLVHAAAEDEVQNWLAEQLNLRSKGRYHAHREVKIAGGDKPDIVIASAAGPVEVGLELKHGGKKWSLRQLEDALKKQLAGKYLSPENRRHGIFVISHHGKRGWYDKADRKRISFNKLLDRLKKLAATQTSNRWGAIEVRCAGINAASE